MKNECNWEPVQVFPKSLKNFFTQAFSKSLKDFILSENDVHIWLATLTQLPIEEMAKPLSKYEQTKAESFHFTRDKDRFIASHGFLRNILALYLNVDPGQISFDHDEHGKPYIIKNERKLMFSMSHSHDLALYAITPGRKIGVDIELVRQIEDIDQIACTFLSEKGLSALPEKQKQNAFFSHWTSREAYIKAIGGSLADICCQNLSLTDFIRKYDSIHEWNFKTLSPSPGYIATIAIKCSNPQFRYFRSW